MNGRVWDGFIPKRRVAGVVPICVVAVAAAAALVGCNTSATSAEADVPMEQVAVGVIDTTSTQEQSRIIFYDGSLEELGELPFARASMGDSWCDACVYGGALYVAPLGTDKFEFGPTDEVLEISLADLSVRPFKMGVERMRLDRLAVNDRYVFASSWSLPGSPLLRCDKQTGEVTQKALPEGSVTQLLWSGGSLFAFMTDEGIPDDSSAENVPSSRALQLDEELNTVREFDLTPYGASVYRAIADGDTLYAVCSAPPASAQGAEGEGSFDASNIVVLNARTGEVAPSSLPIKDALGVTVHDGRLYIMRQPAAGAAGHAVLSVADRDGGNLESYELDHAADQMVVRGDCLYVADVERRAVYSYDDATLELADRATVGAAGDTHTYLTNLFAVGK